MGGKFYIRFTCYSSIRADLQVNTHWVQWREEIVYVSFSGSVWKASHVHTMSRCALKGGAAVPITAISTVASTSRSLKGDSSAHTVVSAAASRPVVGPRSLHAHDLTLGFIMCAHLRSAALEDLYVPKDINAE